VVVDAEPVQTQDQPHPSKAHSQQEPQHTGALDCNDILMLPDCIQYGVLWQHCCLSSLGYHGVIKYPMGCASWQAGTSSLCAWCAGRSTVLWTRLSD
jgi:hypothetical protein